MANEPTDQNATPTVTRDLVRELFGDITDAKIAAVLAVGPTLEDIEEAVAWAAGESDVMGEERLPLTGIAARVYEIVAADEDYAEERD